MHYTCGVHCIMRKISCVWQARYIYRDLPFFLVLPIERNFDNASVTVISFLFHGNVQISVATAPVKLTNTFLQASRKIKFPLLMAL